MERNTRNPLQNDIKALQRIEAPVVQLSEQYCKNIDFRTAIKMLPVIGGYLDNLFAYKGSKIIQQRADQFFKQTSEALQNLEEQKIDKKFFDSDECFYIFQRLYERIIRTEEMGKVTLFRNIFINSIKVENAGTYYKERFINIVADLSLVHIEILKHYLERESVFKEESRNETECFTSIHSVVQKLNNRLSEPQVLAFCNDLLRYDLLYDQGIGRYDYKRGSYRITDSAVEFLNFALLNEG